MQDNCPNINLEDEINDDEDDNVTVSKLISSINLQSEQNPIGDANISILNSNRTNELQDDVYISK